MKKILNMIQLDAHLILRDKLLIYVILAPMIMSAIIMVVLSFVRDTTPTIFVSGDMPQDTLSRLEAVAYVQEEKDLDALTNRVNAFDNMAGVYYQDDTVQITFQGNEGTAFEKEITSLINNALRVDTPHFTYTDFSIGHNWLVRIFIAALLITPALIGGVVSGFNLVSEKETKMSRGYQISPLGYGALLTSRCIFAVIIGLVVLVLVTFVLSVSSELLLILLSTFFALPLFAATPIIIGIFAKDKMAALTLFKVIMLIFLILPISSEFVPENMRFIYWLFPMYWQYQTMLGVLDNRFSIFNAAMTLLISAAALGAFTVIFRKRIKNTMGG